MYIYIYIIMESLNKHRPFKQTGDDFVNSNPIFAYYFYRYFMQTAVNIYKDLSDPSEKSQLEAELKSINQNMTNIRLQFENQIDQEKNITEMLDYTELMFAKNDHLHRSGQQTKQIAEDFLTIYRLYQIVSKFGSLDENQSKRKIYSKKKFIDIMKEIKNNPNKEVKPLPPPLPQIEQKIKKSAFKVMPKPTTLISFNKVQMQIQANKCLENAISELSFDRFKIAREDILKALELLDQIID